MEQFSTFICRGINIGMALLLLAALALPVAAEELVAGEPHIYGPVDDTETLKSIATHIIDNRDFNLRDTMADIYYANPDAFVAGRSQILRHGALLKLPEYLAWNVSPQEQTSTTTEPARLTIAPSPAKKPETPKQNIDPDPPIETGSKEDILTRLQLLKGELAAVKSELAANNEAKEKDARLQGALYLIAALIFLVLLAQILNRRPPPAASIEKPLPDIKTGETDPVITEQKVKVSSKNIVSHSPTRKHEAGGDNPAVIPDTPFTTPSTSSTIPGDHDDDPTPVNPETAIDDPTPMAPSMAYDDSTPASPALAYRDQPSFDVTEEKEEDSNVSDLHEVIHEISGRFKSMSDDKDASTLALARVYLDLGDYKQAKTLLTEAHKSATPEYVKQAEEMIHELLQSEMFASSFNEIIDDLSDADDSIISKHLEDLSVGSDPLAEVSDNYLTQEHDDETGREFEMAQIYFELGDHSRCKQHLAVILGSDSSSFKAEAYALLKEVESKEAIDNDITTKSDLLPEDIGNQPVIKEITPPEKTYNKEQLSELSSQFMAISTNKNGTKLALAHVHHKMGKHEMALKLLKEITTSDDDECRSEAEALIKKIGGTNQV